MNRDDNTKDDDDKKTRAKQNKHVALHEKQSKLSSDPIPKSRCYRAKRP